MRLATFLPPGSTLRAPARCAASTLYAYSRSQELTVLDRLADPEAVPVEGARGRWRK